ncbi:MAG TPA: glycoside hydrolase family 15 protein [Steroidobacteraceae bacterium]|nr:glycoside hydrolase family 15 protein [Steroidobacteraceae bacterium]
MQTTLDTWLEKQYRYAAAAMRRSISAVDLVKERPGFGQAVRALPGSVVASPVLAAYDPDPDYFFHWYRDSAVVMDALRLLHLDRIVTPSDARAAFADFVRFNSGLAMLDGGELVRSPEWRARVTPDFRKFLRTDADLRGAVGAAVSGETRVNPDGTLDISQWARPQNDGPATRALMMLQWMGCAPVDAAVKEAAAALIRADLAFVKQSGRESCFDIWEEERGRHYYTLRVSAGALRAGHDWLREQGDAKEAEACLGEAGAILEELDGFWLEQEGHYRSRILEGGARSSKELDIAIVFAAIHGGEGGLAHSVHDPRVHATLAALEAIFAADYPINHGRPQGRGVAMGRYRGDVYYSGGAYYFSTLAAAELCFRAAAGSQGGQFLERGDAFLETVRAFTPPDGQMSEQFDQKTGAQTSARHLAWSYAALISCRWARRAAVERVRA